MAGRPGAGVLRHSLLDRLIGTGRAARGDPRIDVDELRLSIRRDLEWLLNTRRIVDDRLAEFPEASRSVLTFGLPDLGSYSRASSSNKAGICAIIEEAVRRFEPRLDPATVKVDFIRLANQPIDDFSVHFRISGEINVDPIREPISFDTSMDPHDGMMEITAEEAGDA